MIDKIKKSKGIIIFCGVWLFVSFSLFYIIISDPAKPQEFNTVFNQVITVNDINYTFTTRCYFETYEGEFCAGEKFTLTNVGASVEPIHGGQKYNYTQQITIPEYFGEGTVLILVDIDFAEENKITISFGKADFKFNQEGEEYYFISDINFNTEETTVPIPITNLSIESNPLIVNSHQVFEDYKNRKFDQGLAVLIFLLGALVTILVAIILKGKKNDS